MNVSLIIPVYNAEDFVRRAVASALVHGEIKEILLIEDGSTDNSLNVCKDLAIQYEIVFVHQHQGGVNKGPGATRNLGILKATCEFVSFLDADDFLTEQRYIREKEVFTLNVDADGVYGATGVQYYDAVGQSAWIKLGFDENHLTTINKPIPPENLFEFLIGLKNPDKYVGYFTIDTLTLKKHKLIEYGINFDENLRLHQDTVFIYKCAYYLKLYSGELKTPLAIRGVHRGNRFIHHKNINESRLKSYESLLKWAKDSKINREYIKVFMNDYCHYRIKIDIKHDSYIYLFVRFLFNACCRKMIIDILYKKYFQ